MTPRDIGTEHVRAAHPTTVTRPVVEAAAELRTGARLGWWRTLLGVAAVALGVRYVAWQTSIAPSTTLGRSFVVSEVAALVMFAFTLLTLLDRGLRRAAGTASGTLDVFVPVCGEPPDLVETTVRTALAIEYPHRTVVLNDGRLAGARGWEDIDRLGERLGVPVLTRTTGRRGKAANLNHGLSHSSAEFVATIDADHRVESDLGTRLLGWFADPQVAFVTAAQRFDPSTEVLNNRQEFFYRWIQPAKDAAACAISCGSGVVYRRAALDEIGGFSEWNIVEDLHTSYLIHAAGWTSVYERQPVTTGLAPHTAAESAHQRARWALDSLRLFFFDSPVLRRGLGWRARLHYLHTTGTYLLALPLALFLFGPALYLLLRVSIAGSSTVGEYLSHSLPYLVALTSFFASLVGLRGTLATFRTTLFDSSTTLVAIVLAVVGIRPSGVSRKSAERRMSSLLVPQMIAAVALVASLVVAIRDQRPGASAVAVGWAGVNAFLLIGPLTAFSERPDRARRSATGAHALVGALAVSCLAFTALTGAEVPGNAPLADPRGASPVVFAVPEPTAAPPAAPPIQPAPTVGPAPAVVPAPASVPPEPVGLTKLAPPTSGAYTGVAAEGIQSTDGGFEAWSSAHGGARPHIVSWFQQWGSGENRFRSDWVRSVADQGAVPMITWEPWAKPDGEYADPEQADYRLELIVAGQFDTYVRSWARAAADHRDPIVLRFMHEFNGAWYPWSIGQQGQTAELYVAAWRHVHDIFVEEGATNVSWVWSVIDGFNDPMPAYPGDDVVDWVAATVLNAGWPEFGGWFDYSFLGTGVYEDLVAYGKPVMLSEVATHREGGDPAAWLAGLFATVEVDQPLIGAVVIFDMPYDERTDYRLTAEAADVMGAITADGWFTPPIETVPGSS